MKNKFLTFLIIMSLVFTLVSCGSPDPETEPDMDVSVYNPVLEKIYQALATGTAGDTEDDALYAIHEGTRHLNISETLSAIGYRIEDINGDNVPELLIGFVNALDDGKAFGSQVIALYTVKDGKPVSVAESFARSMYQWAGDGNFYYYGSGGAIYHAFGMFSLPQGAAELKADEFYFTDAKDESFTKIIYLHNNTGVWDSAEAEELDISEDEFWQLDTELSDKICSFEMTQFASYENANLMDTIELWVESNDGSFEAAAAFLGYVEGDAGDFAEYLQEKGIAEKYPFLTGIDEEHTILLEGGEWYAVVPVKGVTVEVYEAEMNEDLGWIEKAEQVYSADDGKPFLIRCNVSEIFPNVIIDTIVGGGAFAYSPQRSMMDGSLSTEPWIYDFTPYALLDHFMLEVIMNPESGKYHYYLDKAFPVSTPVVGNKEPDPIVVVGLKEDLTVRVEMVEMGSGYFEDAKVEDVLYEGPLYPGDVLALDAELQGEDTPLRVTVTSEDGRQGYWYAVAPNGGGWLRELVSAY
ncbi:MAG: hypothetical protein IKT31_07945 [Firmicutes bacterium]|nr:hypothetical protein [Bacillota bacterium]